MPPAGLLRRLAPRLSRHDPQTGDYYVAPWAYHQGGTFAGLDGTVWLYQWVPMTPVQWDDRSRQLELGDRWLAMLRHLGETSRMPPGGVASLADYRKLHVLCLRSEVDPGPPAGATPNYVRQWFQPSHPERVPQHLCFVGVQLRPSATAAVHRLSDAVRLSAQQLGRARVRQAVRVMQESFEALASEQVVDLSLFYEDAAVVGSILQEVGAREPDERQLNLLCAWYNDGEYEDAEMWVPADDPTRIVLPTRGAPGRFDTLEMCSVYRFDEHVMRSPQDAWVADVQTFLDPTQPDDRPVVVSIRAVLEPYEMVKTRLSRSWKKLDNYIASAHTKGGSLPDDEYMTQDKVDQLRSYYTETREPMLSDLSIVIGHRTPGSMPSGRLVERLRTNWGIRAKPLERRQLQALEHCLPTSSIRLGVSPRSSLNQLMSLSALAYAGLSMGPAAGDDAGLALGRTWPAGTQVYLDPARAARGDAPSQSPVVLVVGRPGSGKTWAAQSLCVQAVLQNIRTIFINPKGGERHVGGGTLGALVQDLGGYHVVLAQGETDASQLGILDPFVYLNQPQSRQRALDIAQDFITAALAGVLTKAEQSTCMAAMQARARAHWDLSPPGQPVPLCMAMVLDGIRERDEALFRKVWEASQASRLLMLGIAPTPHQRQAGLAAADRLFTLIEFGRDLNLPPRDLPPSEMTLPQQVSVALLQLVAQLSIETLVMTGNGGLFILDEAYTFMRSHTGGQMLENLGRQGRSQRVCTVLISQEARDLEHLQQYIGRILIHAMSDPRDAAAALRLAQLKATQERVMEICGSDWMPQRGSGSEGDRAALALHRDLAGRCSMIEIAPTPPKYQQLFSTAWVPQVPAAPGPQPAYSSVGSVGAQGSSRRP